MNILVLYQNDSIERLLKDVLELDGYAVTTTGDPAEALRMIEASAQPLIVVADNLKVNPAGVEALTRLRAHPALRQRIRVIGFDIESVREMEMSWGILDDFAAMDSLSMALLDSIEANVAQLAAQ